MFNFFKREFLLGLGIGFIISGIMVSYFGIGNMNDKEVLAKAAKLGMVQQRQKSDYPVSKNPIQTTVTKPAVQEPTLQKPVQPEPVVYKSADGLAEKRKMIDSQAEMSTSKQSGKKITIIIRSGMGSETIAKILEEKGVIKNRNEFYRLITAHHAHSSFKTGSFILTPRGDMEDILRTMTGR